MGSCVAFKTLACKVVPGMFSPLCAQCAVCTVCTRDKCVLVTRACVRCRLQPPRGQNVAVARHDWPGRRDVGCCAARHRHGRVLLVLLVRGKKELLFFVFALGSKWRRRHRTALPEWQKPRGSGAEARSDAVCCNHVGIQVGKSTTASIRTGARVAGRRL